MCTLKGIDFKYKVEAENVTEAKKKVREHIKNSVDVNEVEKSKKPASNDFIDFFNDIIKTK